MSRCKQVGLPTQPRARLNPLPLAVESERWLPLEVIERRMLAGDCPFDDLGGEGRAGKARELILLLQRRGRLDELVDTLGDLEPGAGRPTTSTVLHQRGQQVGQQTNVAGNLIVIHGDGNVVGDGNTVSVKKGATGAGAASVDVTGLRDRLQRLDAVEIESLCMDHFPAVYDKLARGLRRDEMINLLLDHCRRNPEDAARLAGWFEP